MSQFDPALRRETWLFREQFSENGRPVYKRLGFNFVEYDGDPARVIEPVSDVQFTKDAGANGGDFDILDPTATDNGNFVGFEVINQQAWNEVQQFN